MLFREPRMAFHVHKGPAFDHVQAAEKRGSGSSDSSRTHGNWPWEHFVQSTLAKPQKMHAAGPRLTTLLPTCSSSSVRDRYSASLSAASTKAAGIESKSPSSIVLRPQRFAR